MKMPFGRYHGWDLSAIPKSYRRWLVHAAVQLPDELRAAVRASLKPGGAVTTEAEAFKRRTPAPVRDFKMAQANERDTETQW